MGQGEGEGALSSLPVDDGRGAAAAAAEGAGPRHLLGLSLRGEIQQMSAGVRHGVDLLSGAALKVTEEKEQGEARIGKGREGKER